MDRRRGLIHMLPARALGAYSAEGHFIIGYRNGTRKNNHSG